MEHTVIHDEKVDRFEVFESGQIAYLQYDSYNLLYGMGNFLYIYETWN